MLGSVTGLCGCIWSLRSEPAVSPPEQPRRQGRGFFTQLPLYGAAALALAMASTLWIIGRRGAPDVTDQSNRVAWHLSNGSRVGGADAGQTLARVLEAAFPAAAGQSPRLVVAAPDDWRAALALTPLIAEPTAAAVMPAQARAHASDTLARMGAPVPEPIGTSDAAALAATVDATHTA